jgi:pilus assembly protein Flp/PilA
MCDTVLLVRLCREAVPGNYFLGGKIMTEFFVKLMLAVTTPRDEEKGATAVEYGLMVALIAVAIIAAVTLLGGKLTTLFNQIAGAI